MQNQQTDSLGFAIGQLLDSKLYDLLGRPDGPMRFAAHLSSGVVSPQIRSAQRHLEYVLSTAMTGCEPAAKHFRKRKSSSKARGGEGRFRRRDADLSTPLQEAQTTR
jgi:hypothetical protein